jgi:hypothetical protein
MSCVLLSELCWSTETENDIEYTIVDRNGVPVDITGWVIKWTSKIELTDITPQIGPITMTIDPDQVNNTGRVSAIATTLATPYEGLYEVEYQSPSMTKPKVWNSGGTAIVVEQRMTA